MNFNILYTRNVSRYCQQFFILWHTCIIFVFCKIILSFYIPYFTNFLSHTTVYPLEKLNFNNFNFSLFIAPLKRLLSYQNLTNIAVSFCTIYSKKYTVASQREIFDHFVDVVLRIKSP